MEKSLDEIIEKIRKFNKERDWEKYHNIKDLTIALSIEVSELLELFLWKTNQDISIYYRCVIPFEKEFKRKVNEEIADIFIYLLNISDKLQIDILDCIEQKLKINAEKYPV